MAVLFARPADAAEPAACAAPGAWTRPADGRSWPTPALIAEMARRPVVLLGETHDDADHHRLQLQIIAALHARNPNLVLAFESFPRQAQPVLDRWTRGELAEDAFLEESRWHDVWRYDARLYLPLFHFARINRIPMVAMNVSHGLIARVGKDGWQSVPMSAREGVGTAAAPSDPYLRYLARVHASHDGSHAGNEDRKPAATAIPDDPAFRRFVEAQTVWDRAMAERLAAVRRGGGNPLVVGIAGTGHLQYGYGIPHQLRALGIKNAASLLPWDDGTPCSFLKDDAGTPVADAVFALPPSSEAEKARPRLGVIIEAEKEKGVRVKAVVPDSVAAAAGLAADDIITTAAGREVRSNAELIAIVQTQAPGTWLPLTILREGQRQERIAKFPPAR